MSRPAAQLRWRPLSEMEQKALLRYCEQRQAHIRNGDSHAIQGVTLVLCSAALILGILCSARNRDYRALALFLSLAGVVLMADIAAQSLDERMLHRLFAAAAHGACICADVVWIDAKPAIAQRRRVHLAGASAEAFSACYCCEWVPAPVSTDTMRPGQPLLLIRFPRGEKSGNQAELPFDASLFQTDVDG